MKAFSKLNREISHCRKCPLSKSRLNAAPGNGNLKALVFIIGEAPGCEEDLQKKVFVGKSGQLLDELLLSCNIFRKDLFITNSVKCRPPKNRPPKRLEINTCSQYLIRQLSLIKPKLIISLGSVATFDIFNIFKLSLKKISTIHGKSFFSSLDFGRIKIIPTYHPAAALRNPKILNLLKKDFKKIFKKV